MSWCIIGYTYKHIEYLRKAKKKLVTDVTSNDETTHSRPLMD